MRVAELWLLTRGEDIRLLMPESDKDGDVDRSSEDPFDSVRLCEMVDVVRVLLVDTTRRGTGVTWLCGDNGREELVEFLGDMLGDPARRGAAI